MMNDIRPFVSRQWAERCEADIATLTIAPQGRSRSPGMDLGRPLRLLGGHCLGPDGIVAEAAMDWLPDLTDLLAHSCRRQLSSQRHWFWLPATALVDATSSEAYAIARRIARLAGIPFVVMDASRMRPDELRRSAQPGPDLLLPPDPVVAIAASGCANPLVLVVGVEQAPGQIATELANMLDRESGARWLCASLGTVLDLSAVTWMVAASNEHALQTELYTRLFATRVSIPRESTPRMLRLLMMALEVMADHDLQSEEVAVELATMLQDQKCFWDRLSRSDANTVRDEMTRRLLHGAHAFGS